MKKKKMTTCEDGVLSLDGRYYSQKRLHPKEVSFKGKKTLFSRRKSTLEFNKICKLDQLMQTSELTTQQKPRLTGRFNKKLGLSQKSRFLTFSQDFKFKQIITFNPNKNLHLMHGQLVYNNGSPVVISISYQNLFDRILNKHFQQGIQTILFCIEHKQSLVYNGKVIGLPNQMCQLWIKQCEKKVLSQKRRIMHLLAGIGFQIDSQNELMKRIIYQKRCLKLKLQQLFTKTNKQQLKHFVQQSMINENDENNVLYFGPEQELDISPCESKNTLEEKQGKKVEGGYFTIQNSLYRITNKLTGHTQKTTLCRKTLRSKKKIQENAREMNQRKMKKQIQIVRSIKNKKYLIKYYCKRDLDHLQEIIMEKFDYSLQQYINYFADSLEIQHKILIAQQIVEAVIILHENGVVHRDIKPSNFLISDHINNRNFYQLKIIDFAQSFSENISYYEGDYACSHPYSPLQCSELKSNSSERIKQGIKNKEIDYWSVGMLIYQVFFRKLPLSFSRIFHLDIASCWKSQLLLTVNQRQKYGLAVVQDIITILCVKTLKIQQQKRMRLQTTMSILNLLQTYVNNILKIIEEVE